MVKLDITRRSVRWLVALYSVAFAIGGPARANCSSFSTAFGQLTRDCAAGTAYCYVHSPGLDTTATMVGAFWSLGYGNPAPGAGSDNGSWLPEERWLFWQATGSYLSGDWRNPGVDGCIDGLIPPGESSEVMALELSDTDIFNQEGFFAAAAVARQPVHSPTYDFAGGIQRDIVLAQIPLPFFSVAPYMAGFNPVTQQDVAPGFYSDGTVTPGQVIVGYRIYWRDGSNFIPRDRHRSAWNAFSPVVPLGQPYSKPGLYCSGGFPLQMSFAVSLVFAGGFETEYVSRHRTVEPCTLEAPFDLDADGDIRPEYGGGDCNDDNPNIYTGAPELNDGIDNECPGNPGYGSIDEISGFAGFYHPGDKTKFTWHTQAGASAYTVARSDRPDFAGSCMTLLTPLGTFTDPEEPPSGSAFYYLVSAAAPRVGSWGKGAGGTERTVSCP